MFPRSARPMPGRPTRDFARRSSRPLLCAVAFAAASLLAGRSIHLAEVKGPVTDFMKRYRTLAALEGRLEIIEVDSDTPLTEAYSGIVCFETLEHLFKPVEMIEHFHEHLETGYPFAFSVSFGDTPHAPYHVAQNAHLGDPRVFEEKLKAIGFGPYWKSTENHFQIWRKS